MKMRFCLLTLISLTFFIAHAIPLFNHYPQLKDTIAHVKLTPIQTPVHHCSHVEQALGHPHIFVKRDDLTGDGVNLYGGNKVRKLEFLLGDAIAQNAKTIVTLGCVGSNHALASACYARQLGLDCILMLKPQPNSPVVKQNLLLDHYFKATMNIFDNNTARKEALDKLLQENSNYYYFPTGGSVARGALGFVNAAFELKEQIENGLLPEPDFIYLPIGSCGTTAGLLLGLQMAGIKSKIVAVAVEPAHDAYFINTTRKLFQETNELLQSALPTISSYEFPTEQLILNTNFKGPRYGELTLAASQALEFMFNTENLLVEGTYSAKAVAAFVDDIKNERVTSDHVILWWNTYCGLDFTQLTSTVNYNDLPTQVHHYFEQTVA